LVLEAKANELILSWAVSKPVDGGKLAFTTHGKIDFRAPLSDGGKGPVLDLNKPKHRHNARRGLDLLRCMADFGYATLRGEKPQLDSPAWPVFDPTAGTEDYSPVLGQPARAIPLEFTQHGVPMALSNPAAKILARHGLENAESVDQSTLEALESEMRAELRMADLSQDDVYGALLNADAPVSVRVPLAEAIVTDRVAAEAYLRSVCVKVAAHAATAEELFSAALEERQIILSQLSRIQLVDVDQLQATMPEHVCGDFLSPVDWRPAYRRACQEAPETEAVN